MFTLWGNILVTALLVFFSYLDIRYRQILWPAAAMAAGAGFLLRLAFSVSVAESLWGILPGALMLVFSRFCGEAVGKGDCYTLAACGVILGIGRVFELFVTALVFAAAWSVLLMIRKRDTKQTFAFMPFMLAAQICMTVR